jgi:hypothetical protein
MVHPKPPFKFWEDGARSEIGILGPHNWDGNTSIN